VKLRLRLLSALAVAAAAPLAAFSLVSLERAARAVEASTEDRLERGLGSARARLRALERRAAKDVQRIAEEELAAASEPEVSVASALAARHGLDALAIVGADGRVLSSHHWTAGYGLPDADRPLAPEASLFVARVAAGLAFAERLAILAESRASWRGRRVTLRGGFLLDDEALEELSAVAGADVAIVDVAAARVFTRPGSSLSEWRGDPGPSQGEVSLGGQPHRWRGLRLGPGAHLLAVVPAEESLRALYELRRSTLAIALMALLGAVALATLLAAPLLRRVEALHAHAERLAAGERRALADASGGDELGELGRAMNALAVELRTSEARLVQASRVAAWRDVARRLAHELKNPLFPIQLSVETLRRAFERREESKEALSDAEFRKLFRELSDTILRELRALRGIVEEFSSFARMPRPQLRMIDLGSVVERVLELHRARLAGVDLRREAAFDLPPVSADPDLLAQAISNLVANALDAMQDHGTLVVATRCAPRAVEIAIVDSGPGLSEEAQVSLFQPYHTTKPGGTGLGLVIVQSIVSDHRGTLEVASVPGAGATFTIRIPV
jgi:two-component system, NtrC family, nitrogen regulation sensor histidine kinase NtrY